MPTFRKKPVEIQAVQFDGSLESSITVMDFINGRDKQGPAMLRVGGTPQTAIVIKTLEGDMLASAGDWIIRGVQGEFYPCKPDIFDATYEPVHVVTSGATVTEGDVTVPLSEYLGR